MSRPPGPALVLAVAATVAANLAPAAEIVLDSPMDHDPEIELPGKIEALAPSLKALWIETLSAPESEMRMRAAEAIAQARARGLDDLKEAVPHLLPVLREPDQGLPVRLAAARALIVLEAREAAADLLRQAERDGPEMRQVVEPVLAAWDYRPARSAWLDRLDSADTPHQLLVLAVRCLGGVREPAASERLRELTASRRTAAGVRLEAAKSLAEIESAGLEDLAEEIRTGPGAGVIERLISATMLKRHRGDRAVAQLKGLASDAEPAVATVALRWLFDADPALIIPLVGQVLRNRDSGVRRLGCEALVAVPSPEAVAALGPLLDDPHPGLRGYVRDSLYLLSERPELDGPVRGAGTKALAGGGWRGPEQAAMLLGALDHEPAADRLLELIEHPRPETKVAAAWALRKLAVARTLPPMLAYAERQTGRLKASAGVPGANEQLAQIFQTFGETVYRPADGLLRDYVPKQLALGHEPRAAAVWALGHLHAGVPNAELVRQLEERMNDVMGRPPDSPPEFDDVRRMAAATLGRMKAESALPTLRKWSSPAGAGGYVAGASNWAVSRITGESFPKAPDLRVWTTNWFLEPL
jgi:HEAT repeat protein